MKMPLKRPVTRRDVKKFTDYCVLLRSAWMHYQQLSEEAPLKRELLASCAPSFFGDICSLLHEHLILQICKLTDDAVTRRFHNLTVEFLVLHADAATPKEKAKLKAVAVRIEKFRKRLTPARNKLIGHLDLDAAHSRRRLGRASEKAWNNFWQDLQQFLMLMHRLYMKPRTDFYLNGITRLSDADNVITAMKESRYFRDIIADHSLIRAVDDIARKSKFFPV